MPSSKKSPILPRYLVARLRVLQRPSVWKAAAVPSLALLFASLYWMRPAWLGMVVGVGWPAQSAYRPQPQSGAQPSAIPAASPTPRFDPADLDIDTLPNLGRLGLPASRSSDLSPSPLPNGNNPPGASVSLPVTPVPSSFLPDGLRGRIAPSPSLNPFSPNYAPSPSSSSAITGPPTVPLGAVPLGTGDRSLFTDPNASPVGGTNALNGSPALSPPVHPLESALQRQAIPSPQGNASTPLLPGVGLPGLGQSAGGDRLAPASTPRLSPTLPGQSPSGSYAPRTSPPLGSTGYTLPSGGQTAPLQSSPLGGNLPATGFQPVPLRPGSANLGSGQNSSGAARPQFGNGSFYTAPPTNGGAGGAADPEPPPFSSSDQRGRNGQINTFSNP